MTPNPGRRRKAPKRKAAKKSKAKSTGARVRVTTPEAGGRFGTIAGRRGRDGKTPVKIMGRVERLYEGPEFVRASR